MAQFVKVARTADLAEGWSEAGRGGGELLRHRRDPHASWRPAVRGRGVAQEGHV